jgi:hypothetical protein
MSENDAVPRHSRSFCDVISAVFSPHNKVVAQHRPGTDINDHQQPDPFDFEFVLEAQRIRDNDFEPDVEAVTIELHHLIWSSRRGQRYFAVIARKTFEVRSTG